MAHELLVALELHSPERIRALLDQGCDPRAAIDGKAPLAWLTEMYTRSNRLPACVQLLLDRGGVLDDPALAPVLLDDGAGVEAAIRARPALVSHRVTLRSAFTPLVDATLLHVAAEYGHVEAVRALVAMGADVNARAGRDEHGLNGHTPLFHTVNTHANRGLTVLKLLLDAGARTDILLPGITWGKGFEWETTLLDVTPLSYAQLGLLPQMHRTEADTYRTVRLLLEAAGRVVPVSDNVPNRYLQGLR